VQLSRILLALMLFIAPLGARGQEPTQPASSEEPCSVSADPSWTQQETFVWERVCAGEAADFNAAPGYGGPLDPTKPDDWPQNRVLSSKFLQAILLKDSYRSALTRNGVLIVGARFSEAIDLYSAELEHQFGLMGSLLEKGAELSFVRSKSPIVFSRSNVMGLLAMNVLELDSGLLLQYGKFTDVSLAGAHVNNTVRLDGSKVSGRLIMRGLKANQGLLMTDEAEFADVNLFGAHVGDQLDLSGSKVTGKLYMGEVRVDGDLFMLDKAEFADVDLSGAHVGGYLDLSGSKVTDKLIMNGLQVDGSVVMRDGAGFADVDLVGAHVGGWLGLSGSKVTGKLNMNSLQVDGSLFMGDKAEFADVDLVGAHVGSQLDLSGSKVTGKLDMDSLQVSNLFMRNKAEFADVDLRSANVGRQLDLKGSKVAGNFSCPGFEGQHVFMEAEFDGRVDCPVAKIKGDLYLVGQFKQDVNLSGAEIDGSLQLSNDQRAQWADGVTLVLHDAKVLDTIPGLADAWAPKLDLDGFTYRSVGKADDYKDWFGRLGHYAPQPYDQLASVVQSQGNAEQATAIRYSSRERERNETTDLRTFAWLTTLKGLIGYGYYPYYAIRWAIALVIMGALVLRVSGEGPRNGMPYGLSYSFDTLLPIIRLREKHYQIDLKSWPRYYFYFHKIMGYVLAAFLAAGLAGLTK
jgi:uncharacterized protein YjbI with pentapeptide repeats